MGYQALYRRYRPARFEDFVGQEAVIKTLRSQITSGRIAHAYLFCGTRGTGKTSTAKVFARAVNCEHPENGDPCGTCDTCRALAEENSLDILEIDAASNNGVDEIRDLREKVKYPPQTGRYRVYIIDEVHMLSQGAFNALLKTLEEPPAYVVFILATTEPQKLPATILSRCQRFDFGRIPAHQIIGRLRVALEEGHIQAEDAALSRIARAAEGGMRDAWSIMDMCLSYAQEEDGGLTEALVLRVLGAADKSFLFAFADRLIDSDAAGALALIDEMMRKGREVQVFVRDVSAHLRALMLADICGEEQLSGLLEVTREDAAEYVAQAKRTSHTRLMRMLDLFLASETDMKWAAQPRFAPARRRRACRWRRLSPAWTSWSASCARAQWRLRPPGSRQPPRRRPIRRTTRREKPRRPPRRKRRKAPRRTRNASGRRPCGRPSRSRSSSACSNSGGSSPARTGCSPWSIPRRWARPM